MSDLLFKTGLLIELISFAVYFCASCKHATLFVERAQLFPSVERHEGIAAFTHIEYGSVALFDQIIILSYFFEFPELSFAV
jgi:hypothetical protein